MKNSCNSLLYFLIALVLVIGFSQKSLLSQGNALIVPGEEVGVLKLGNPIGFVMRDLGDLEPSTSRKVDDEKSSEMWLFYQDLGLTLIFDYTTKTLKRIIVLTPSLLVKGTGVHVGSKESEVLEYFKDPGTEDRANALHYPHLGITFLLREKDRTVYAIEIEAKET